MDPIGGTKVTSIEDVTSEWLSNVLKIPVESFTSSRIGTGQVSWTYRLTLKSSNGPKSVVLKVASSDPHSRGAGLSLGLYEKEVCFYQTIWPALSSLDSLATCYHASWDPSNGTFALLLGDAQAGMGNDLEGATIEQARVAVTELGKIHGSVLRNSELLKSEWLAKKNNVNQAFMETLFAGFVGRYKDKLKPASMEICRKFIGSFDAWQAQQQASKLIGLVHGDYRLDNMIFGTGNQLTVVDWQTVVTGPIMVDFAYFTGSSLKIEDRQKCLDELLEFYIDALGDGTGMTKDLAKEGLRTQTFFGVMMCIASPMLVERTERGDEMFMTMMERHCAAITDLHSYDTLDMLPKSEPQAPLRPNCEDEYPHSPGSEELWNESWYFDVVDEKSGVGAYVRLGRYPNLQGSWYTAVITHPTKGLLAVTDYQCPHPGEDLAIHTSRFRATHEVVTPLQDYGITLKGTAEHYPDPAAVLRGEKGKDVEVEMGLLYKTEGVPYKWKMTTRYEIPCLVSGTIVVDGEKFLLKDVVAQRDHSHGVRDWASC
jgi:hypothetical protein